MNTTSYMPMWHGNRVHHILIALMTLAIGLTACSDKNDDIDDPTKPVVPVNPEDYQDVSAAGGTITKGDIAITFPSGTFSKDTKVAITEVKKGDVLDEDEASVFYQVTMPVQVAKAFTVKVQCPNADDGVNVIAHMPSYQLSEETYEYTDIILESTYSDGEFTATMPASGNASVSDAAEISLCFGAAHAEYIGQSGVSEVKTSRAKFLYGEHFTEGNFSWHFFIPLTQRLKYKKALAEHWDEINATIREAIKKLHDLGLEVTERDITISFKKFMEYNKNTKKNEESKVLYGTFSQSPWKNELSSVQFSTRMLDDFMAARDGFRRSAMHELMHVFQADYDSRWPINKAGGMFRPESNQDSDELVLLYESGAVWAEQFLGGDFSSSFANQYTMTFIQGFNNIDEIYAGDAEAPNRHKRYEAHGYGASVLMQYITRNMKTYGLNDKSIVDLYKIWHDNKYIFSKSGPKDYIEKLTSSKGHNLFMNYYDFLLALAKGEVVPDMNVFNLGRKMDNDKGINNNSLECVATGTCYEYGCMIRNCIINLKETNDFSLKNMALIVEQTEDDAQTTVLVKAGKGMNDPIQQRGFAYKDHPDTISGKELYDSFYSEERGGMYFSIATLTTPSYGKNKKPYRVLLKLQSAFSVSPDSLAYSADGGTQSTYINYGSYSNYGATVRSEGHGWCGVAAPGGPSGEIKVTVQPNTTGKKRECIVDCYVKPNRNSPDSEKVLLPVKVTQEAGDNSQSATYKIEAYLTGTISVDCVTKYNDGRESKGVASLDLDFYKDEIEMEYAGGTLKVQVSDDDATPETLSFSVSGLTGDYTSGSIQSIKYEKEAGIRFASGIVKDANNYSKMTLEIGSLPLDVGSVYKGEYGGTLWFIGKGENLKSVSLKYHIEQDLTDGSYGPVIGHKTSDYSFHSDESNYLGVKCGFWRKFDYSSVPRSVTPQTKAPSMPWNGVPAPSGASLSTYVEASVQ